MRRKTGKTQIQFELITVITSFLCLAAVTILTSKHFSINIARAFAIPAVQSSAKESVDTEDESAHISLFPMEETEFASDNTDTARDDTISLAMPTSDAPTILIYHTHTLEAYTPTAKFTYKEYSGRWRTDDTSRSVVAVGEALAQDLRKAGFNVIHDTTDHEPPKLATAYERSLVTIEKYKKKYPSLMLFIDLHRDATDEDNTKDFCVIDGQETARVMFVVGHGTKYDDKPDFDTNYAAAQFVTNYLRSVNPKLARDIREKPGRYNQHMGACCMLIEIGHNMNTLEQALAAVPYVAQGIAELAKA